MKTIKEILKKLKELGIEKGQEIPPKRLKIKFKQTKKLPKENWIGFN